MNILYVASEAVPLAKTGGLADVIGALPKALRKLGADVRVIMPKYEDIQDSLKSRMETVYISQIKLGWRVKYVGLQKLEVDGIPFYFIDNEYYFKRRGLYGYEDEAERFVFFSRAVAELLPHLGFVPDIVHAHDWQSGLIPLLLKLGYAGESFRQTKTVYTIHNLRYQGNFPREQLKDLLGLDDEWFAAGEGIEFHGGGSCMKAGIVYADRLTTVSETYALEIQTPEYGERLDGVLRERCGSLIGIVNGVDYEQYDPMKDPALAVPFRDSQAKKKMNKAWLQRTLGLDEEADAPLVGIVTRLVWQKGIDLIAPILEEIIQEGMQLVVLGTGDSEFERLFVDVAARYPQRVAACITFNDALARQIYAGSDLFLMPSRFEPCGLGQLLALRYRSVPVVRETGGLKDTVMPFNEYTSEGTGFSFAPARPHDLLFTLKRAAAMYRNPSQWDELYRNICRTNFDWTASAKQYMHLYENVLNQCEFF
jgi:starch synthase